MNEPIGYAVGNTLEVKEAIECLHGNMPEDIKEIVLTLGSYMIKLSGKEENVEEGKKRIIEVIESGKAYEKFCDLVKNQGGDVSYIEEPDKLPVADYQEIILSQKEGYIKSINAEQVGKISCELGAGRKQKTDKIDLSVGIVLHKKVGDKIQKGEKLATIYANSVEKGRRAKNKMEEEVYKIQSEKIKREQNIIGIIL